MGPKEFYCLELGAVGYACKMILYQFISSNIYLIVVNKYIKLPLTRFFIHQFSSVTILFAFVKISIFITEFYVSGSFQIFFVSGFIYSIFSIILVASFPNILALKKKRHLFSHI